MAEMTPLNRVRQLNSIPPSDRTVAQTAERVRLYQGLTQEEKNSLQNSRPTTPTANNSTSRRTSFTITNGGRPITPKRQPLRKSRKSRKSRKTRRTRK
jgi:hypothetical protein